MPTEYHTTVVCDFCEKTEYVFDDHTWQDPLPFGWVIFAACLKTQDGHPVGTPCYLDTKGTLMTKMEDGAKACPACQRAVRDFFATLRKPEPVEKDIVRRKFNLGDSDGSI